VRVLFLTLEPPYPPNDGGRIRTYQLLRQLAGCCQVSLLSFESAKQPDVDWTPLQAFCSTIEVLPRPTANRSSVKERLRLLRQRLPNAIRLYDSVRMAEHLQAAVATGGYDLLHVSELFLARYAALAYDVPKIMDHTDVETLKQRRILLADKNHYAPYWWLRWIEHCQWRTFERRSLAWFDAHTVVSDHDASYFRRYAKRTPICVVPNGVNVTEFASRPDPSGSPTLVYVGSMDYFPNVEAVLHFVRYSWPHICGKIPGVRLLIVGRNPPTEIQRLALEPGIGVTGTVPDVQPYYQQAHALVVPLKSGGGTRLKILEAMAMGVPVVSTTVGVEGLGLAPGTDFLLADTPQAFAAETIRLLCDQELRTKLATRGRKTVVERYDWSAIGDTLLKVYETVVDKHKAGGYPRDLAPVRQ